MERLDDVPDTDPTAIAQTLDRVCRGDDAANGDLSSFVYADLRRLAANLLKGEGVGHTLQPTALVSEAWLRLVDASAFVDDDATAAARRVFLAQAATAMRRILIDHARAKNSDKRGGGRKRVPLSESKAFDVQESGDELLDIDATLEELATEKPRAARIAELRIFGGLSTAEAADAVEVSLATAKSDWSLAKALLTLRVKGLGNARK